MPAASYCSLLIEVIVPIVSNIKYGKPAQRLIKMTTKRARVTLLSHGMTADLSRSPNAIKVRFTVPNEPFNRFCQTNMLTTVGTA